MKEYIVTNLHKALKEGAEIKQHRDTYFYMEGMRNTIYWTDIEVWLEKGWIKEIEQKEFTQIQMIYFALDCVKRFRKFKGVDVPKIFDLYYKQ